MWAWAKSAIGCDEEEEEEEEDTRESCRSEKEDAAREECQTRQGKGLAVSGR